MTKIYCVWLLEYVDDYKLRGERPCTLDGPHLFTTQEEAEAWLCKSFLTYLEFYEPEEKNLRELGISTFFNLETRGAYTSAKIDEAFKENYSVLRTIVDALVEPGEYISCKPYEWGYEVRDL